MRCVRACGPPDENRHVAAARKAALLRLAAPPPCLESQPARALPALQGLVRDPLEHLRIAPVKRAAARNLTPAERRAHRHVAARRPRPSPSPPSPATPRTKASGPCGASPFSGVPVSALKVLHAALALVATQTPRQTARNRPFGSRSADSAGPRPHQARSRPSMPRPRISRPDSTASASRRCARVSPRAAESHAIEDLETLAVHNPTS